MEKREDSLAARLRAGDRAAANEFVDNYYRAIYLYLRRLGHGRAESEDLTQEIFLRALNRVGQLRDGKALGCWLYRIAGNISRNYRRRLHRSSYADCDGFECEKSEDGLESDEELRCLQAAVLSLPLKLRQAVVLHYMQDMTISEASEAAGVREGTLKSRLNRGLEMLRKRLDGE